MRTKILAAGTLLLLLGISPMHQPPAVSATKLVVKLPAQSALLQTSPAFYHDVLPIVQQHYQRCHRAGGNAPGGNSPDAPPLRRWSEGWNIAQPDRIIAMPKPVALPARGDVDYTYEIVPTKFAQDAWIQMSEMRPSSRENVHHAVVYIRPPDSKGLRSAPVGVPFIAEDLMGEESRHGAHWTDSDILLVYAPGSLPDQWPVGMAKFVPAGSDLVFQMHYTTHGRATSDQTSIGIVLAKEPPKQRVLTLQLTNAACVIPPGADDFRVGGRGSLRVP